ncbi:MAG: hypothetical protein V2A69_15265 [Pseudomonadota bacterium]
MKKPNFLLIIVFLLLITLSESIVFAGTLKEIYINNSGSFVGVTVKFDMGFPSEVLIDYKGYWDYMETSLPGCVIEINNNGNISILERDSSAHLKFKYGRIERITDIPIEYYGNNRVRKVGDLELKYSGGLAPYLHKIGDFSIEYDNNRNITKFGSLSFGHDYLSSNRRINRIGEMEIRYDRDGRIKSFGDVDFNYDDNFFKGPSREIPGVSIKVKIGSDTRKRYK